MATAFDKLAALHEACDALVKALEDTREEVPDEVWDAAMDGPWGNILGAAMDVEYWTDRCNVS